MNRNIYAPKKLTTLRQKRFTHRRQTMSHFIHTLPVPICVIDRLTTSYLEVNQSYVDLLGLQRDAVLHHRDIELPAQLGAINLNKILALLEVQTVIKNLEIFVFDLTGNLIKSSIRAEMVDYCGREALLVTFTKVHNPKESSLTGAYENRLQAADRISREFAEIENSDRIVERTVESCFELLPDICTVLVSFYDSGLRTFSLVYGRHETEILDIKAFGNEHANQNLMLEIIHNRQTVITDKLDDRMRAIAARMQLYSPGKIIQAGIHVPMISHGEGIGILQVFSTKVHRFHDSETAVLNLVSNAAAGALKTSRLASSLERTSADLNQTYDATIDGWSRALELRDFSTERHTQRVVSMTMELGKTMGLDEPELLRIKRGAQLHDIGKMGIPDTILLKPGPLDEAEWRVMRKHPVYAYELLRPIQKFNDFVDIPYCHHEKWDGTGYPRRLRGAEIPLTARLFSIVDVWDALSSNRPYRPAWPQHQVLDYIRYQSNRHFEPEITRAFLEIAKGKNNHKPLTPAFRRPAGAVPRDN